MRGGLFVPESFPQVDVKALVRAGLPALAAAVVREYLTDYDPAFLTEATRSTSGGCLWRQGRLSCPGGGGHLCPRAVARPDLRL